MWKYIKKYAHFAVLAAVCMAGEVLMDLLQPEIMSRIVDEGVLGVNGSGGPDLNLILALGLRMMGLVVFGGVCGAFNNMFVHLTGQNIGNDMRKDCFKNIMTFSFEQTDRFGTGSLITRVTNDITQVQNFISQFVRGAIRTTMLTFGSIFFMFQLSRRFGLIVLCAFPFMAGCLAVCLWKVNPFFTRLQSRLDDLNAIMQEDISGIRIIKACVREAYEKLRFGKANTELVQTQLKVLCMFALMNPLMNAAMYLVAALILTAGFHDVGTGMATPGTVMAALTYATQLLNGILMTVMLFQNISRGIVSWKRVREILQSEPELKDGPGENRDGETLRGQIEFRNVSFVYPGSRQMALKNVCLTIRPGETVAVMGSTGCGKTTLLNLLLRFYDATEGTVLVDGTDVRTCKQKELREKIAAVLQKSELFHTTIRENIAWGKQDAEQEEIACAAAAAQADRFISRTQDGYDTMVAEQGMSLSGGQKQRISIARGILKNAEILVLDDATSALDLKTEAELYRALEKIRPDCTKVIIAQRIASVRRADRIVVMESGRILASGTHEELLKSCREYQEICRSQLGEEGAHA